MTSNIVLSTKEYKVVGKRPIRHDGYDKVTGKAQYGADINLPGLLHGKVLRSPHAHARIVSVDTRRAEAHPQFRALVTSADFAPPEDGSTVPSTDGSNNILARDKVLYKGHAILAVAATSHHVAEEILSLVDVQYEVLPAVTNIQDAIKADATVLHEDVDGDGNQHGFSQLEKGDVEKGFREADVIVEREFHTDTVHQGYIEPHTATAWWLPHNKITLWFSSQGHFQIRDSTAKLLGIPSSQIKAVPLEIGGGFGGKTTIYLEPVAALLSKKAGQPVKLTMTRSEVMEATGPTSGTYSKLKIGATKDGRLTAVEGTLTYEAGAFPGSSAGGGANCMLAPYHVEDLKVGAYSVFVN